LPPFAAPQRRHYPDALGETRKKKQPQKRRRTGGRKIRDSSLRSE
jgi:hypothetical protein